MFISILALFLCFLGNEPGQSTGNAGQPVQSIKPELKLQSAQPTEKTHNMFSRELFKSLAPTPQSNSDVNLVFDSLLDNPQQKILPPLHPSMRGGRLEPIPTIWPEARKILCDQQKKH